MKSDPQFLAAHDRLRALFTGPEIVTDFDEYLNLTASTLIATYTAAVRTASAEATFKGRSPTPGQRRASALNLQRRFAVAFSAVVDLAELSRRRE